MEGRRTASRLPPFELSWLVAYLAKCLARRQYFYGCLCFREAFLRYALMPHCAATSASACERVLCACPSRLYD